MTLLRVETVIRRLLRSTCERVRELCPAVVEVRTTVVLWYLSMLIVDQEYKMMIEVAGELSDLLQGLV